MPADAIDSHIASLISQAQVKIAESRADDSVDDAKKRAEQKNLEAKQILKKEVERRTERESDRITRDPGGEKGKREQLLGAREQKILGEYLQGPARGMVPQGAEGKVLNAFKQDPQNAAGKLALFNELMERHGAGTGQQGLVKTKREAGTILNSIMESSAPMETSKAFASLMRHPLFGKGRAAAQVRQAAVRFTAKNHLENKPAVDRLQQAFAAKGMQTMPRTGQVATMGVFTKDANNAVGQESMHGFLDNAWVLKLPPNARAQATGALAKTQGDPDVRGVLQQLAHKAGELSDPNKGRLFATIGCGRPSDVRAVSDKLLLSLQGPEFPRRQAQVKKFLMNAAETLRTNQGRGQALETHSLLNTATHAPAPERPGLLPTAHLEGDELAAAKMKNRAKLMNYANQYGRYMGAMEKHIKSAKYMDDLNQLPMLRGTVDPGQFEGLSADEAAHLMELKSRGDKQRATVQKLWQQQSRALRGKRRPRGKLRTQKQRKERVQQRHIRAYFNPGSKRVSYRGLGPEQGPKTAQDQKTRWAQNSLGAQLQKPSTPANAARPGAGLAQPAGSAQHGAPAAQTGAPQAPRSAGAPTTAAHVTAGALNTPATMRTGTPATQGPGAPKPGASVHAATAMAIGGPEARAGGAAATTAVSAGATAPVTFAEVAESGAAKKPAAGSKAPPFPEKLDLFPSAGLRGKAQEQSVAANARKAESYFNRFEQYLGQFAAGVEKSGSLQDLDALGPLRDHHEIPLDTLASDDAEHLLQLMTAGNKLRENVKKLLEQKRTQLRENHVKVRVSPEQPPPPPSVVPNANLHGLGRTEASVQNQAQLEAYFEQYELYLGTYVSRLTEAATQEELARIPELHDPVGSESLLGLSPEDRAHLEMLRQAGARARARVLQFAEDRLGKLPSAPEASAPEHFEELSETTKPDAQPQTAREAPKAPRKPNLLAGQTGVAGVIAQAENERVLAAYAQGYEGFTKDFGAAVASAKTLAELDALGTPPPPVGPNDFAGVSPENAKHLAELQQAGSRARQALTHAMTERRAALEQARDNAPPTPQPRAAEPRSAPVTARFEPPALPALGRSDALQGDDRAQGVLMNKQAIGAYVQGYEKFLGEFTAAMSKAGSVKDLEDLGRLEAPADLADFSHLTPEEAAHLMALRRAGSHGRKAALKELRKQYKALGGPWTEPPEWQVSAAALAEAQAADQPKRPAAKPKVEIDLSIPLDAEALTVGARGALDALKAVVAETQAPKLGASDADTPKNALNLYDGVFRRILENPQQPNGEQAQARKHAGGKEDGWGVARTFERDLGGARMRPMERKQTDGWGNAVEGHDDPYSILESEAFKGMMIVKPWVDVRDLDTLLDFDWKALNRGELALLRNLGWNQTTWVSRRAPGAQWPATFMTYFADLNSVQRESVRKLGIAAYDWDQQVQNFLSGLGLRQEDMRGPDPSGIGVANKIGAGRRGRNA